MQLEANVVLALALTKGILDSIAKPIIGKVDLAAFLKKSLRDWSSSFLFLLDIKLIKFWFAYELPTMRIVVNR